MIFSTGLIFLFLFHFIMKTFTDDWLYVYIEYEKQEAHVHGLQPPNHLELKKKKKKKKVTKQIQKKIIFVSIVL